MKYLLAFLVLVGGTACYPADEMLSLPNGGDMRMHCEPVCPAHDDILTLMARVDAQLAPFLDYDPYDRWEQYAQTYHTEPMFYAPPGHEPVRVAGITLHNRRAIGIWYPYDCAPEPVGTCMGVLGWELKMAALEKELPYKGEAAKLEWLTDRNIQN